MAANAQIKLNNEIVQATASARSISITTSAFIPNTQYTLVVADNSLSDVAGNFVKAFSITLKQRQQFQETGTVFEAENTALTGDAAIVTSSAGYSGTGYVNTNTGNVSFTVQAAQAGYYNIWMRYQVSSAKTNDLYVDGKLAAGISFPASNAWSWPHKSGYAAAFCRFAYNCSCEKLGVYPTRLSENEFRCGWSLLRLILLLRL